MPKRISLNHFYLSLLVNFISIAVLGTLFTVYVRSEKEIDRANDIRHMSFLLADELRQSSDDLTRMVRTYIATGNALYKAHFQEIMAIRDGKIARPIDYQSIYWDLVDEKDVRPRPLSQESIPLLDLMKKVNFTDAELSKLAEAKTNSDVLTATEFSAMKLMESTSPITEENRRKATLMVHDKAYHQAKVSIMKPIDEFYSLLDKRTYLAVKMAEDYALKMRIAFIVFGFFLLLTLLNTYRYMRAILGCSLDDLYTYIARIGSGDFNLSVPVDSGKQNSIAGWLSETQEKLFNLDIQNKQALTNNKRLTNLYAALSQCNQSIYHSLSVRKRAV